MSLRTPKVTYKAYTYRSGSSPIELVNETIGLVEGPHGDYVAPKGKILVKINYASLNPVDYKVYQKTPWILSFYNPHKGFGKDFSGRVISIGANAQTDVKVGDLVQGLNWPIYGGGSCAQYLLVNPVWSPITTVPTNIDLIEAASFPLVLGTAMQMTHDMKFKESKVLVLGAGTSVGRYNVQLAKIGGAREIVTTNSAKTSDLIRELGATSQIDYRKHPNFLYPVLESVKQSGQFDYILDCWGGNQLFPEIDSIIKRGGRYYSIVGDSPEGAIKAMIGTTKARLRMVGSALGLIKYHYTLGLLSSNRGNKGWINLARDLIQAGKLQIFVDSVYPFNELHEAIDKLESGGAQGKIVLEVAKPHEEAPQNPFN
ncbi:Zinc-binding dehydrogenase family protein [Candida parapsilosis]|uniref:PKS_ER domain-containing protein n=2 Tax=Candida parapsilosis TaxID=5480 RepID=G8BI21_CANPC|nr:uncharacterized protein CPAR2_400880 [Candida parapsilosis]KAF6046980.1 Zinc-binding dehydrogenase family protein [Candida parapsilosis]KAF6047375.1 Zinc-binding dehydrogenase family protein [Candida parapsilosis]KAF6050654.1 Zinc-binding dehydrogenase family protein [Candida parapsilosis]KAF6061773.1 Zinc-binding dehydrogenase family protein [Candida parapsilosis]KAI5902458.1 Protein YIM1 [Candida parapsilosis]